MRGIRPVVAASAPGSKAEVLVVGAGPVGMTAAALLAALGIRVCLVEREAATSNTPKAISLDDESLRIYQQADLADRVLQVVVPGTGTTYFDRNGERLFHGGAAKPHRFGYPFKNPFAQPDLEQILHRALLENPLVDVRFATALVDLHVSDSSALASLRHLRGETSLDVRYVLAADGGSSTVRQRLGISMAGRSHSEAWLVVDCREDEHAERYGMHHGDPVRPYVIVPGADGRCRYEFYLHPGEAAPSSSPPFELIQRLLGPHRGISPHQVERAAVYRFHGLNAERWRHASVFLLGDAAHMMPPFAGQGLNSGVRDAFNLTWKIAEVLRGGAADSLLDTYEAERRKQVQAVIRSSERLGRVVMTTRPDLAEVRDAAVRRALGSRKGRAYLEQMRYRPSMRTTVGLVVDPDDNPIVGTMLAQPRVFDFRRRKSVLLDCLLGPGWSVLGVGIGADADGEAWQAVRRSSGSLSAQLVDVPLNDTLYGRRDDVDIALDTDGSLVDEVGHCAGRFLIVRPDRVVAACVDADGFADIVERINEIRGLRIPSVALVGAEDES